MSQNRYSAYQVMWILVFFDLPTNTRKERKVASDFRKSLLKDGFTMFQYSIYIRHCPSRENMAVHKKRVKQILPKDGMVTILGITDKQFGKMDIYHGRAEAPPPPGGVQLNLF